MASKSIAKENRPHVIGRGGDTLKRIRSESGATVDIHRSEGTGPDTLVVCGTNLESVEKALAIVQQIVDDQEKRMAVRRASEVSQEIPMSKEQSRSCSKNESTVSAANNGFPPGYSGRSHKTKPPRKEITEVVSVQVQYTPAPKKIEESKDTWQSVVSKKTRKPESAAPTKAPIVPVSIPGLALVDTPARVAEVKPVKVPEAQKTEAVFKTAASVSDSIASTPETLFTTSETNPEAASDLKLVTAVTSKIVQDMEWQTIKGGKVVKAEEFTGATKKKRKNKKKKNVDQDDQAPVADLI